MLREFIIGWAIGAVIGAVAGIWAALKFLHKAPELLDDAKRKVQELKGK